MNEEEHQRNRERLGLPALYERLDQAHIADRIAAKRRRVEQSRKDLRYMQLIGGYDGIAALARSPQYQREKRRQRIAAAQTELERMAR